MVKFFVRRLLLMLLTMFLVSVAVFAITEAAPGNVARNVLGIQITPEQEASFLDQNGLDEPIYERYFSWLFGTDWRASMRVGLPIKRITTEDGFKEWWAVDEEGTLVRWQLEGEDLIARRRQPDGTVETVLDNGRWQVKDPEVELARLEAYREELQGDEQLRPEERQAIAQELDRILEILRTVKGEAALSAALAQPEGALESMVDADVAERADDFEQAASDILQADDLSRVVEIYATLSSEGVDELEPSQLQTMVRQLNSAADTIEAHSPAVAADLRQAVDHIEAGDIQAATQVLAGATEGLDELTGSLAGFASALRAGNYQQASAQLANVADPSQVALDETQLGLLPDLVDEMGDSLEDASEPLSEALLQAAEALGAGDVESARAAFDQAAVVLSDIGYTISRSEAAREARVVRTFWGVDT
ncbi:MAG: hypothetical protein ACK2UC_05380, partial [Anaerolineae bacterium]